VSRVADAIRERVSLPYWIGNEQQQLTAFDRRVHVSYHGENARSYCTGPTRHVSIEGADRSRHERAARASGEADPPPQ